MEDSTLSELFWAVARRLRHLSKETLEPLEISPSQARAIGELTRHGSMRPGVLAEHLRIAARSATEVIDDLQDRGLVERDHDPADRRATLVSLTAAGRAAAERIKATRRAEAERFFGALEPADRDELARILGKLRD
ncbi:MarR family winged helix-turn-helix transcriptional regulator [Actinoplanes sp. NPDC051494]|uniref:MarR family winged helix-turn-helix transcriptional regulator n=1 Tax=Actinoplanes sp. NPDC051494 TaxID=3363907 RepID=UPI00379E4AD5